MKAYLASLVGFVHVKVERIHYKCLEVSGEGSFGSLGRMWLRFQM
jgi:hypothetical protein